METLLLVVTVACVVIAFVTSCTLLTRLREAQERTAARADALRALAFGDDTSAMFGGVAERGAPVRRWVAFVAVAAVMLSIAGLAVALHVPPGPPGPPGARPSETARLAEASLELLTLRQTTDRDGTLVIRGELRTSGGGQWLPGVVASVDLYGRNDQFIAGKKMPLPALRVGETSAFTVAVPKAAGVARYRVQFRRTDGSLVPHIDHRARSAANSSERTGHEHLE